MTSNITERQSRLISIGMPVRNEARFLRESLDSLVAQTEVDFEIFISDNASTDETPLICQEYCSRYSFIRYNRFETNVGASANFRYVLDQAEGAYFMWASGHDRWASNYLLACLVALEANPDAVIAFGSTSWIDETGAPYPYASGWSDTRGMSDVGRYFTVFWGNMNAILGLIRRNPLSQQEVNDMVGVDLAILLGLALRGNFLHASQTSWNRREFRRESNYQQKLERYRNKDFALSTSFLARYFPLVRLPLRIVRDLFGSSLPLSQKFMVMLALLVSLPLKYIVDKTRRRN